MASDPSATAGHTIALVGNPNTGKTTLFNALTGLSQRTGNYPGVTVEYETGQVELPDLGPAQIIDLPGTYSLSASSPDEAIAVDVLLGQQDGAPPIDIVIAIADASNLRRHLYLLSQVLETGHRVVLALNMADLAQERGIGIDELRSTEPEDYTSLISVVFQHGEKRRVVSGTLFGKRDPRIVRFDDFDLDAVPEGHMLFYRNDDVPGIIGRIGSLLGSQGVNIAQLSLGRDAQGASALSVLNVDSRISDDLLEQILGDGHVTWARRVAL